MRPWVGVHRLYSCVGYQAARQEEVGASPSCWLNKSLHFIKLGHHQLYNARDFSEWWNIFCQKPRQVQKGVCLTCYPVLIPMYHKLKEWRKTVWKAPCIHQMETLPVTHLAGWQHPGQIEELMVPLLGHPRAPEQPAHTLSLGHAGCHLLPEPGMQRPYPTAWESPQLHLSLSSAESRS